MTKAPLLGSLALVGALSGCECGSVGAACVRDGDCGEGSVCWVDDRCVPRAALVREGYAVGDECTVDGHTEYGCEADRICRGGYCVGQGGDGDADADADSDSDSDGDGDADADGDAEAEPCTDGSIENMAPVFGGLVSAVSDGPDAVALLWLAAADETLPEDMTYLVYVAEEPGAQELRAPPLAMVHGETALRVEGLTEGTTYYFVVRAEDSTGQVECNQVERSATPAALPDCIDYEELIQPIFTASCVQCHSGDAPPQGLHLDAYDGVIAGGSTGTEVLACQPDASLLYMKVSMDEPPVGERMPRGGPYLSGQQIATIRAWIAQGATRGCPADPALCADQAPPEFAGLTSAALSASGLGADLCWDAATDDITPPESIEYDVWQASRPGDQDFVGPPTTTSAAGQTCLNVEGLSPGQEYCWVVRARDSAGNRDDNAVERCIQIPAVDCVDYRSMIQPLFDAHCTACHSGAGAPQGLVLTTYDGVLAGGATGGEVLACQSESSLLYMKIALDAPPVGERMPRGGPYLSAGEIALVQDWIDQGAQAACPGDAAACSDATPPAFGGITSADVSASALGADLCWNAATDDVSLPADIVYDVWAATAPGAQDFGAPADATTPAGATCTNLEGLSPGQRYCFVVRARDASGNRDGNVVELCVDIPAADCIDYATMIQPLLDAQCTRCHSGANPPQGLTLTSREGVLAGGATGSEVVACQAGASLLYMKVAMDNPPVGARMPFGGPYLAQAEIDLIRDWIDAGAQAACPIDPGACSDATPPAFGGITSAALSASALGADLCWNAATDDTTPAGQIVYDVWQATSAGGEDFAAPPDAVSAPGATCTNLEGLSPGQRYCFVVRARDAAGNRDANVAERCVDVPAADCIDYDTMVQPLFDANCTRCHSGGAAPRGLQLDTYAGVMAGGLSGNEVVACQSGQSLLGMKISMANPPIGEQMPLGGPYLAAAEIQLIQDWIDAGAQPACPGNPGACDDATPPVFAGLASADVSATGLGVDLCWDPASDDTTAADQIVYDAFLATSPGAQDFAGPAFETSPAGATCLSVEGLVPTQEYCFVVRARDGAGNRDANEVELCVTIPDVACVDYETMVQPIFDRECVHCHSGRNPPKGVRLDTYQGAMDDDTDPCRADGSKIYRRITADDPDDRMPYDGPPWLLDSEIDIIRRWIDEGAWPSCPNGGC